MEISVYFMPVEMNLYLVTVLSVPDPLGWKSATLHLHRNIICANSVFMVDYHSVAKYDSIKDADFFRQSDTLFRNYNVRSREA